MKLANNVHCLKGKISNIYLLDNEVVTIVDSGCCPEDGKLAIDYLQQEMGHRPSAIQLIVLTHGHPDHSGGASYIAHASGAPVAKHPSKGSEIREWGQIVKGMFSRQQLQMMFRMYRRAGNHLVPRVSSFEVTKPLKDEDTLPGSWRVLYTPGHSYDSICLYNEPTGSLISGDTIVTIAGVPKLSSVRSSPELFDMSLERISGLRVEHLLPGHGQPLSGIEIGHLLSKKRGA